MKEKNLYIAKATWAPNTQCISKRTPSKVKKMFATQMIFELNRPIQLLNNTETTEITATFIGSGANKYVYDSHIGILIKIEPLKPTHSSSIEQEYIIQQYQPIGITPIANVPPKNTRTHIWDWNNTNSIDIISCMQLYKPIVVQNFLEQLVSSKKNKRQKTKTFATFFVVLYVNLIFQTLSNIQNSLLPGDLSLNNMSLCQEGLVTFDFERFQIITQKIKKNSQTKKLKKCFENFVKRMLDFCSISEFHYQEMNEIITILKKWNDDMCFNFENGTLHDAWSAPMFTPEFLNLIAQTFKITSYCQTLTKNNPWPDIKQHYTIPNIYFLTD